MKVEVGNKYRHFKGNLYEVIELARSCEDLSDLVVYKDLEKGYIWVRGLEDFTSLIDKEKYPELEGYRFTLIE